MMTQEKECRLQDVVAVSLDTSFIRFAIGTSAREQLAKLN